MSRRNRPAAAQTLASGNEILLEPRQSVFGDLQRPQGRGNKRIRPKAIAMIETPFMKIDCGLLSAAFTGAMIAIGAQKGPWGERVTYGGTCFLFSVGGTSGFIELLRLFGWTEMAASRPLGFFLAFWLGIIGLAFARGMIKAFEEGPAQVIQALADGIRSRLGGYGGGSYYTPPAQPSDPKEKLPTE